MLQRTTNYDLQDITRITNGQTCMLEHTDHMCLNSLQYLIHGSTPLGTEAHSQST